MTALLALIAVGVALIVAVAIVVGIVDAAHAPSRREVAAERRQRWEARQPQPHGVDQGQDEWDDGDDD